MEPQIEPEERIRGCRENGRGSPKDLLKVGLTQVAYHVLGLTDNIRVTASDVDWGVLARHPHGST